MGSAIDEPGEEVGKVAQRVDTIELRGLDWGRDRLSRVGAAVKNLAQNASFRGRERTAPSNSGIEHLCGPVLKGDWHVPGTSLS